MILEKFNELVKQLIYDLKRPGDLDEDIEIECRVERLCIMLTNLELLYPNASSVASQLLDSIKSILGILKSKNTNCDKKNASRFQLIIFALVNQVHQNLKQVSIC